jgi:hypothetical protein
MKCVSIRFDGKAEEVTINAALDHAYEKLFRSAQTDLNDPEKQFGAGIQLIIFGCFWLEAVGNETLHELLRILPSAVWEAVWEELKRSSFLSKFKIISAFLLTFSPEADKGELAKLENELKTLFDLRNRLAHFKDAAVRIPDVRVSPEDMFGDPKIKSAPEPELLALLRPPRISQHEDIILRVMESLLSCRGQTLKERDS